MGRVIKFFVVALLCLFSGYAQAQTPSQFVYQDANGREYRRHILVDKDDLSTLLLVIDEDLSAGKNQLPQEVVFRKRFPLSETSQLFEISNLYKTLELAQKTLHTQTRDDVPGKPLWEAQGMWDQAAEDGYNEWVDTSVTPDMLIGTGIEVDCADLAVLLRWIYARNHHLPAANSLAATGKLFGHFSGNAKWDTLPTNAEWKKDQRFIAGLRYMLNNSYTHSIAQDLYPTEINLKYVTPGSVDLYLRPFTGSGHTEIIKNIEKKTIMALMANEPAREALYMVPAQIMHQDKAGFMRWRWPELNDQKVWVLRDSKKMPGYSTEQYQHMDMVDGEFEEWLLAGVGIILDNFDKASNRLEAVNNIIWRRKIAVDAGAFECYFKTCNTETYNELSTPALDEKFRIALKNFTEAFAKLTDEEKQQLNDMSYLGTVVFNNHIDQVPLLGDLIFSDAFSHVDSDAKHSIPQRWGFADDSEMGLKIYDDNFLWVMNIRNFMVNMAQYECFQNHCDPNSKDIQNLNTSNHDQRLKNILPIILQKISAPSDLKKFLGSEAQVLCPTQNGDKEKCTYWDVTVGHPEWFQNMSPYPQDTLEKRYGIPE